MLPERIVQFLKNPLFVYAATRTSDLIPQVHFVCAWSANATQMTFMVSHWSSRGLREAVSDNGQVALTLTLMPAHETYQIKGDGAEHREPTEDDLATFEAKRATLLPHIVQLGSSEEVIEHALSRPVVSVCFNVREVFLQTPGPDAGTRIVPEAAG